MNAKHFSFLSITDVLKGFPATREKKGHFLAYLLYVKIIKKMSIIRKPNRLNGTY